MSLVILMIKKKKRSQNASPSREEDNEINKNGPHSLPARLPEAHQLLNKSTIYPEIKHML